MNEAHKIFIKYKSYPSSEYTFLFLPNMNPVDSSCKQEQVCLLDDITTKLEAPECKLNTLNRTRHVGSSDLLYNRKRRRALLYRL